MIPTLPRGRATALVRSIAGAPDPLALYRAASDDGRRPATLLFETAETSGGEPATSFVMSSAALVATCRGRSVHLAALSTNGEAALAHVVARACSARSPAVDGTASDLDGFGCRVEPESLSSKSATLVFAPRTTAADMRARLAAPSPFDALRAMASFDVADRATRHAVFCAGVFAYDLVDALEDLPAPRSDPLGYPDFVFFLAESLVVIDHASLSTTVVCAAFGSDDERVARTAYNDSAARVARLVDVCRNAIDRPRASAADRPRAERTFGQERDEMDDLEYERIVATLQEHIARGDVFQIVPSRTFREPCTSPIDTYEVLRTRNPSPYMFFFAADDHTLFGASPETSVRVARSAASPGEYEMEIRPIAGTRRRGFGPNDAIDVDLDNRQETELLFDEKERAEHMMLVDLARNDVARVCRAGTRRLERLLTVERYSHVMHMVSRVTGVLAPENDALAAYAAAMNMGTLVGAPKVRAAELLREHELSKRGPYGGAIGYFTGEGELDTAVVIRSALVKDGIAHVRAGAGVVHDSRPSLEAAETNAKAAAVMIAMERAHAKSASTRRSFGAPPVPLEWTATSSPCDVVFIDNFDSFTFNLVDAFERIGCRVRVFRNTMPATSVLDAALTTNALIVLSPGPGSPEEAGSCLQVLGLAKGRVPVLGVCLGHQAMVLEAGGVVDRADSVVHGKTTLLQHDGTWPFNRVRNPLLVGRYHSLATRQIPARFRVHASIGDMAMAISDRDALQVGFQFHPESILTPEGHRLLEDVVTYASDPAYRRAV